MTESPTKEMRTSGGRFAASHDLRTLADVVAAVARAAAPGRPERVTQRAYDAARASAGHPDAPRAAQTAVRFSLSWAEVLALALDPELKLDLAIGKRYGEEEKPWLGADDVRVALRIVANRLGKKTLTPGDYRAERTRLREQAALARRHRVEPPLPTEGQLLRVASSWDKALEIAGLAPRPRDQPTHAGMSVIDALELALEAHGCLPSEAALQAFVKANGLPLARRTESFTETVELLRERRADWGKWTPAGPLAYAVRRRAGIDFGTLVGGLGLAVDESRRRRRWTRAECLAALQQWQAELPAATRPTQRAYQDSSRGRADLPALTSIQVWGKWSEMVAEARRRKAS